MVSFTPSLKPRLIDFANILESSKRMAEETGQQTPKIPDILAAYFAAADSVDQPAPIPMAVLLYEADNHPHIVVFGNNHPHSQIVVIIGEGQHHTIDAKTALDAIEQAAKTDDYARETYKLFEEYMHDQLIAYGVTPHYATSQHVPEAYTDPTQMQEDLQILYLAFSALE